MTEEENMVGGNLCVIQLGEGSWCCLVVLLRGLMFFFLYLLNYYLIFIYLFIILSLEYCHIHFLFWGYICGEIWQGWYLHWVVLKLSALNPFINEINVPGVMLSLVIHIEVLGLNELIFLAEGYSLNRHLPGKICRGAFRPSAFWLNRHGRFMPWAR